MNCYKICIFLLLEKKSYFYDYTDILTYDISPWESFEIENNINKNLEVGEIVIRQEDEFIKLFNEETKNVFLDIDWSNIIIAGGFIFGLLNKMQNSIIPSTDIDIFVYGDSLIIQKKVRYLLNYFNKYNKL